MPMMMKGTNPVRAVAVEKRERRDDDGVGCKGAVLIDRGGRNVRDGVGSRRKAWTNRGS